jgi:hypothetical protein
LFLPEPTNNKPMAGRAAIGLLFVLNTVHHEFFLAMLWEDLHFSQLSGIICIKKINDMERSLRMISPHFDSLLSESVLFHGHLCPGQALGVRMSLCGMRKIGIEDPNGVGSKSLSPFDASRYAKKP